MGEKVIGIIGGIGPEATVDLFKKILKETPARNDQEHIRILIDCNPKIPDRVQAILAKGEDPAPALMATARNLEKAGADILLLPCNAAHYYYRQIASSVSIPILHLIEETARFCARELPSMDNLGLLAQSSTIKLGLYEQAFEKISKKIIHPIPKDQEIVRGCIYEIKAGNLGKDVQKNLIRIGGDLVKAGSGAIIMGCTEIPLLLQDGDLSVPLIDPTQIYAKVAVAKARGS